MFKRWFPLVASWLSTIKQSSNVTSIFKPGISDSQVKALFPSQLPSPAGQLARALGTTVTHIMMTALIPAEQAYHFRHGAKNDLGAASR